MAFALLLTVYLGLASVIQGGVNRKIALNWGYPETTFLNALVLTVASGAVFLLAKSLGWGSGLREREHIFQGFNIWYVAPGLLGFSLVILVPYVIEKIGAMNLFVALIGSQLLASATWDYFMEGIGVSPARLFGAALAFIGATIAALSSSPAR
jgi:uncharacterized membrane protein YdcZ (DUF606 family)